MKYILLLPIVLFLHIVDDFHLQGILANMKQRKWWTNQATGNLVSRDKFMKKYGNDYKICLLFHAFSWSFTISIPYLILIYINLTKNGVIFYLTQLFINTLIHAYIDDLKANKFKINLIQDQIAHLLQIILTFIIFYKNT